MEARGFRTVSSGHYDHAKNNARSICSHRAISSHGGTTIVVVFDSVFQAYEIPEDHAGIFSIESLEDRWHLVFARRDQVSTRSTLEFRVDQKNGALTGRTLSPISPEHYRYQLTSPPLPLLRLTKTVGRRLTRELVSKKSFLCVTLFSQE